MTTRTRQTMTAEALSTEIRHLQWKLETWIPEQITKTTHARRLASLRRQRTEDTATLSRMVTDLGAAVQAA